MSRTFWITTFIAFANSVGFTILIPVLYLYGKQFELNEFQTGLLFSIYAGSQFISTPIIGKLSDRYGRKPLLVISLLGTVIANLMAGTANAAWILFFARFLDGITGGNVSVAQAIVADVIPPQERAKAFGIFSAATFGLGFILGPIASYFAQQISLGASFIVAGAIALVALLITTFFLPETLQTKAPKAQNIFDLGLGNLISGLTLPKLGILLIINFLVGTTFTIFTFGFQPYFLKVLNRDNQTLTLMFVMFGTIILAMQAKGLPWLLQKFSVINIFLLSLGARGFSFVLMPLIPDLGYFVAISILFSIFNAFVQPTITTLISLNAKADFQGTALGLNASYLNVSNAFGPLIAGALIHPKELATYSYPFYVAGVLTIGVFGFAIATRKKYVPAQ